MMKRNLLATFGLLCLTMILMIASSVLLANNAGEQQNVIVLGHNDLWPPGAPAINQLSAATYIEDNPADNTLNYDENICATAGTNATSTDDYVNVNLADLWNNKMHLARIYTDTVTAIPGHHMKNAKISAAATRGQPKSVLVKKSNDASNGTTREDLYALMRTASDDPPKDTASANMNETWRPGYNGETRGHTVPTVLRL